MGLWTLIKDDKYIRFNVVYTDDSEEKVKEAFCDFVHPLKSMFYENPSVEYVNIEDYKIIKIK